MINEYIPLSEYVVEMNKKQETIKKQAKLEVIRREATAESGRRSSSSSRRRKKKKKKKKKKRKTKKGIFSWLF